MANHNFDLLYTYTRNLSLEITPTLASPIELNNTTNIATNMKVEKIAQENDQNEFHSISLMIKLTHDSADEQKKNVMLLEMHYVGVVSIKRDQTAEDKIHMLYNLIPKVLVAYLNSTIKTLLSQSGVYIHNISMSNFNFEKTYQEATQKTNINNQPKRKRIVRKKPKITSNDSQKV